MVVAEDIIRALQPLALMVALEDSRAAAGVAAAVVVLLTLITITKMVALVVLAAAVKFVSWHGKETI